MVKKVQYDMLIMCVKVFLRPNALQKDKLPCELTHICAVSSSSLQEVRLSVCYLLRDMPPYVRIPEEEGEGGEGRRRPIYRTPGMPPRNAAPPSFFSTRGMDPKVGTHSQMAG